MTHRFALWVLTMKFQSVHVFLRAQRPFLPLYQFWVDFFFPSRYFVHGGGCLRIPADADGCGGAHYYFYTGHGCDRYPVNPIYVFRFATVGVSAATPISRAHDIVRYLPA